MTHDSILRFDNITFRYPDGAELFSNLSFSLKPGRFYLIKGPSGAGKSSLLRLMNRLEEPSEGDICFNGVSFSDIPAPELRRSILYIQQTPVVMDATVRENLMMPFRFKHNRNLDAPEDHTLTDLLDEFGLEGTPLDANAKNMSVGQQQRLCLIRGLLLAPEIVLLDEPTSALDDESSRIVEKRAESLCIDKGKTVVMVSHREFRPETIKPHTIELKNGVISISD